MDKILSIIIPTYNAEAYLDKCLNSIMSIKEELLARCEVIVVNDGTPDNSMQIAERYSEEYQEIYKLINKDNGGHGSAINVGIQHVTGTYFKILDADDWVDFKEAEKLIEMLEVENADAVITGYTTYHIGTEEYVRHSLKMNDYSKHYNLAELMERWKSVQWGLTFHGMIYRTEFYRSLRYELIEHVYYEDQEYATIPLCYTDNIRCADGFMYVYRIGDVNQSVSDVNQIKRLPDARKVIERMLDKGKDSANFAVGGKTYWEKKTSMLINSYYEIALLKKRKSTGRKDARTLGKVLEQKNDELWRKNRKKYLVFAALNYLGVTDRGYRRILNSFKGIN